MSKNRISILFFIFLQTLNKTENKQTLKSKQKGHTNKKTGNGMLGKDWNKDNMQLFPLKVHHATLLRVNKHKKTLLFSMQEILVCRS